MVIIEGHLVGVVLAGCLTEVHDSVHVFCFPGIGHQLESCSSIVGSDVEHVFQHGVDTVLRHFLQVHVRGLEYQHVRIGLQGVHLSEECQHFGTVAAIGFVGHNLLTKQIDLVFLLGMTTQQQTFQQRVCREGIFLGLIIVAQGHQGTAVVRFFLQHLMKHLQRLFLVAVHHEQISVQTLIVQVVGILLGQFGYLFDGGFLVAHLCVAFTLGHRQAFALSVNVLDTFQNGNGIGIILHLLIEREKHLQQILPVFVPLIETFHNADGCFIILLLDIDLCQCLHVGLIVGIQLCRPLEMGQRK